MFEKANFNLVFQSFEKRKIMENSNVWETKRKSRILMFEKGKNRDF